MNATIIKICKVCSLELTALDFYIKDKKTGRLSSTCKKCECKAKEQYHIDNRETILNRQKSFYDKNKDRLNAKKLSYYKEKRAAILEQKKEYTQRNKEIITARRKESYAKNKDKNVEKARNYRKANREAILARLAIYRKNNPEKVLAASKKYLHKKLKEDSVFKFKCSIRTLIGLAFMRACNGTYKKSQRTEEILGCSLNTLFYHIESQFLPGMSWERRSEFHIDHIIPLATAKTEEDIIRLNHYTNLRPLWATDNIRKGAKIG